MVEVETIDAAFKAFQYNVGNLNVVLILLV